MTPKEKAEAIFESFFNPISNISRDINDTVKICALIAVKGIYDEMPLKTGRHLEEFEDKKLYYSYWEDVMDEIRKL